MEGQVPHRWARRHAERARSTIALAIGVAALVGALGGSAAAAGKQPRSGTGSHQVIHNPRGRFLGVLPSTLHRKTLGFAANGSPPLTYHGGPVQHSSKVYAIFW